MTPAQIVTRQIEAYNKKDIEANMVLFSDDFEMIRFSDGHILIDGKDFDNKIILHEYVQGRNGSSKKAEQLIIFEIVNNKIARIYRL